MPDETMIQWEGAAPQHMSYLPRKPHPLGFMVKSICDATTRIMLNLDLVEGSEVASFKKFNAEWGKSTGCTLRLAEPWFGSWRTLIGDSWFASVNTALACSSKDLHFVGNVKTGHKHYPKSYMQQRVQTRGDTCFMKKTFDAEPRFGGQPPPSGWPQVQLFAASHCDKKPCHLIATRGSSIPGKQKIRYHRRFENGNLVAQRYTLQQPVFHELYRNNFNAVDVFNRQAIGPNSLINVVGTKVWWKRVLITLLGMAETNAYLAFCHLHGKISRFEFRKRLSE